MITTTTGRLTTGLARLVRHVNNGHVSYDWATGKSTLRTNATPVDVTHLTQVADLADLIDVPEGAVKWRLTGKGIQALVRQGARA